MARAASALSPTVRTTNPQRVRCKTKSTAPLMAMPRTNSTFTCSAERTADDELHQPSGIDGRCGAVGPISGLPKKNASPTPKSIKAIPTATSLTRGRLHSQACSAPSITPTAPAASTPSHGDPVRYETP